MYLILKDNDQAQNAVATMAAIDKDIMVNKTTYAIVVKAPNIGGVIHVSDKRVKAWKVGEPSTPFYIYLKDIISVLEL